MIATCNLQVTTLLPWSAMAEPTDPRRPDLPLPATAPPGAAALAEAADRVGDRWSLQVVGALLGGPRRFGDLSAQIPGIAPNTLSNRIERLEALGLLVGEPYSRRPVRHVYRLTAAGAELADALRLLAQWGAAQRSARSPRDEHLLAHASCGTALETRWYCATCGELVDDDATTDLHWV